MENPKDAITTAQKFAPEHHKSPGWSKFLGNREECHTGERALSHLTSARFFI
jgi:hypothetical protein